jgi:ADP-ribosylglycohydrolase
MSDVGAEPPAEGEGSHVEDPPPAAPDPPMTSTPPAEPDTTQPAGDSVAPPSSHSSDSTDPSPSQQGVVSGDEPAPTEEATPTTEPAIPPQPVFDKSWSSLSRDTLIDKIKGVIYGQAIGDALGLATEFMTKKEAAKYYGKNGPEDYTDIVQDFHRSRWQLGDWTDDTDQLLLILQVIVEGNGMVDKCEFAKKMLNWRRSGFQELDDYGGMGIGMTVSQTLSHSCFTSDPHRAAREVWERSGRYLAANGAVMRTAILGVLEFNKLGRVVENTREICLTTHADPRCLASCVAVTTAIALMLQGRFDPHKKEELKDLVTEAVRHAQNVLEHEDQRKELETHIRAGELKQLDLESRNTMGYTFKAVGAGFYSLRTATEFEPTVRKVIMEAGDADTNAAVCGALMGCKFGFSGLPKSLLCFPHRDWLDKQVEQFLANIGLNVTNHNQQNRE